MKSEGELGKPSVKEVSERLLAGHPSGYGMMSLIEVSKYLAQGYLDLLKEHEEYKAFKESIK